MVTMDNSEHSTSSSISNVSSSSVLMELKDDEGNGPLVVPNSTKSIDSVSYYRNRRRSRSSVIRCNIGSPANRGRKFVAKQGIGATGRKQVHWGEDPSSIEYYQYSQDSPPIDSSELRTLKWYLRADIQAFKEERKAAARLAASQGVPAVEASGRASCRGLEHMTNRRMSNEREQRQRVATQVVLDGCSYLPPAKRRLSMEHREQLIAMQYQSVTKHCQDVAHERARAYWKETQDMFKEDHGEDYKKLLLDQVISASSLPLQKNGVSSSYPTTPKGLYNRRRFLNPGGSAGSRRRRGGGASVDAPHSAGSIGRRKRGLRGFLKALPIA